jgi:D-arabinose 1-dehydrogenase-like Zn-dependent alcohol dehydrogenase
MAKMKAAQISRPGGDFEVIDRDIPEPQAGEVRIRVEACGVCHSDAFVKEGLFPGLQYPRIPGHEVVGKVDKLGPGVNHIALEQRVGVGWHGGHDFICDRCRAGDFVTCENEKITGISFDGGYAQYMVAPHEAIARVPDALESAKAAPLLCAGITTFNALRNSGARPGDLVAVQGIGGLGHLGLQYARQMGFTTVAIGRGGDKQKLAQDLGASLYIDTSSTDPAAQLTRLGGARIILATAPNSKAISALVEGLAVGGQLLIVAADATPLEISPLQLIGKRRRIQGWPSGTAWDSEETLRFSAATGVRPMIQTYPLEQAAQAYQAMITGKVRFRAVLEMRH